MLVISTRVCVFVCVCVVNTWHLRACNRSVIITCYCGLTVMYALHWTANEDHVSGTRTVQLTLLLPCQGTYIFGCFFVPS